MHRIGCPRYQVFTIGEFLNMPQDCFYNFYADLHLMQVLKILKIKTLIDVNAHFAKSYTLTKMQNDFTEIEGVYEKNILPIKENIYSRVYKSFADCQFKHYDAALIYVNSPTAFENNICTVENSADTIITFAKYGSELYKYIHTSKINFVRVDTIGTFSGEWLICRRHKPPENFAMYVATHKKLPPEYIEKFPAGYKIIHAGKENAEDFGYIGDNTGKNISYLNPYINEITALYWMWKNTSDSVIGLSHYRRFFTASEESKDFINFVDTKFAYEKILTKEQAMNILKDYDIILTQLAHRHTAWYEDAGPSFAFATIRKHLMRTHPDYIDAFDYLTNVSFFYSKSMFVTRRNIFDAYCKWFFSFYIDATREVLNSELYSKDKATRMMGFLAERISTIWLMKNNLRIKELKILERLDL